MNLIDARFQSLRTAGRKAFLPFLTAGDPSLEATGELIRGVVDAGADIVEVGFPYSDPIADGPVIQASYTRALARGIRVDAIFASAADWCRAVAPVPLVAMISYSLVHRRGTERFLDQATAAGFSGAIIPDLPVDEAEAVSSSAAARDFKLIQLVTPTTPPDRAARIARMTTGFLYYVSVTGITGERRQLPPGLVEQVRRLRQTADVPVCVGFGISTPEQVRLLRDVADGVIVGSALVRRLDPQRNRPTAEMVADITALVKSLRQALDE